MPRSFETPLGVKDYTPESLKKIEAIIEGAKAIAGEFSYQGIKTPVLEYFQTVGRNSRIREDELIRFTGPLGRMLIIRPDLTTPIARMVASTYRDLTPPFRLFTYGDVYRNDAEGFIEEKTQVDFELIGKEGLEADGEIINIAARIIQGVTGSANQIRITLGHTRIMEFLLEKNVPDTSAREELLRALSTLDYVQYRKLVEELSAEEKEKEKLLAIMMIRGGLGKILELEDWYEEDKWKQIFRDIREIRKIMGGYQLEEALLFDPALVGRHKYYTGIIFTIYAAGSPYKIASGGRYDGLIGSFGRDLTATGMAIDVVELSKISKQNLNII